MGLFDWFHRNSNPGPPPQELGIMPLHYIPYGRLSEVKPRQTHLLLGWATTWDKTSILRFPALGVRSVKTQTVKKLQTTIPDCVVTVFFSILGPLGPGNCVFFFLFGPVPKFLARGQKQAKIPLNHRFRPLGVPKKVAENHPG